MSGQRFLIVNADDFGLSDGINRGIIRAHENGIVTSASLMVRAPAAAEAAAVARKYPRLSVGLHVDIGEWIYRNNHWEPLYEVLPANSSRAEIEAEVQRQLAAFRDLMEKPPTHVDSHQHAHRDEPLQSVLREVCDGLQIPLRDFSASVTYRGDFYGQSAKGEPLADAISVSGLCQCLASLEEGVTELGCHPGIGNDFDSVYLAEREIEVATLCDPRIRNMIDRERIALFSFNETKVS